jgi:hypothetical protein
MVVIMPPAQNSSDAQELGDLKVGMRYHCTPSRKHKTRK